MENNWQEKLSLQKALDKAVCINFEHQTSSYRVRVIGDVENGYDVVKSSSSKIREQDFEPLATDYTEMTYDHIASIGEDFTPLKHWEEICGAFQVIDGEILRFILAFKVPLEKIIRYELACRGHDKNHEWVGFEKAQKIWLTENN
jgi:hypothetical protein